MSDDEDMGWVRERVKHACQDYVLTRDRMGFVSQMDEGEVKSEVAKAINNWMEAERVRAEDELIEAVAALKLLKEG